MDADGTSLFLANGGGLNLSRARISGTVKLGNLPGVTTVNLAYTKMDVLHYSPDLDVQTAPRFSLVGLTYENYALPEPANHKERESSFRAVSRWLRESDGGQHFPQPYRQLIKVLREHGYQELAVKFAIEKRRQERASKYSSRRFGWRVQVALSWLNDRLTGYGYRPFRVVVAWATILVLGIVVYGVRGSAPVMTASETEVLTWQKEHATREFPPDYPVYVPWLYAADEFIPIINLGQADHFRPSSQTPDSRRPFLGRYGPPVGAVLTWLNRFLEVAGWLLSTLLLAAYSGVIRQVGQDD